MSGDMLKCLALIKTSSWGYYKLLLYKRSEKAAKGTRSMILQMYFYWKQYVVIRTFDLSCPFCWVILYLK